MTRSLTVVAVRVLARVSEVVPLALRAVAWPIAVSAPMAGAMPPAIIQWRAAPPWRWVLRQLPEPDWAGAAATTAAVGALPLSASALSRGITMFMAPADTMVVRWRAPLPWRRALRQLPQPDGAGTSLTAAAMAGAAAGALATALMPL